MQKVFTYLDFREYLRDFYEENKKSGKFSYREFARLAGFTSPVFIKLLIEGKSNLRKSSIPKITQALGLANKERLYFKYLVLFNQAKDIPAKMNFLRSLQKITSSLNVQVLNDEKFEYFSEWYHSVVRELINQMGSKASAGVLAELVYPAVSIKEIEKSVSLLKNLGMVLEEPNGELKVSEQFISSRGIEMQSLAIKSIQRKMTLLAADAIESVPKEERDISGVTIGVSNHGFKKIQEELEQCRTRILEIAAEDKVSDRVYRVNLHLYPLSGKVTPSEMTVHNIKQDLIHE